MARVQKYKKPARVFHWIHTAAFLALLITGIILFVPAFGAAAQDSWTRVIHRIGAVVFVLAPLIQIFANPKTAVESVKKAFTWGKGDLDWAKAMPQYYFLSDDSTMPPQDEMNTGQKMWYTMLLIFGPIFIVTGILMWFFKYSLPSGVFQWSLFAHDVSFIVIFLMFLLHIYLGIIHPMMRQHGGCFRAMVPWDGTVSEEYAKSHHGKWYEKVAKK